MAYWRVGKKIFSLHPIRNKNIGVMGSAVIAVGGKDELGSIKGEHRKGIEGINPHWDLQLP